MLTAALVMIAALSAGDPEGVVNTAPGTTVDLSATAQPVAPSVVGAAQAAAPHGMTTDQQIDRWLEARRPGDAPYAEGEAFYGDDRKMHGEVDVSIGTGGYRAYGAAVSLPIGDSGRLDLSYSHVENGYFGYPYDGYGYGRGYGSRRFDTGDVDRRGLRFGAEDRRVPLRKRGRVEPAQTQGDIGTAAAD